MHESDSALRVDRPRAGRRAKPELWARRAMTLALVCSIAAAIPAPAIAQGLSKLEIQCSTKLAKSAAKLSKLAAKFIAACRQSDVEGPGVAQCPDATAAGKLSKVSEKLAKTAAARCGSVCSVSTGIACLTSSTCPPVGGGEERCTAGSANKPFDMRNIGFPGPYCEQTLGRSLREPADLAECVSTLTLDAVDDLIEVLYGSLGSASLGPQAASCLASISKPTQKLVASVRQGLGRCRDDIARGKRSGTPATCISADEKLTAKINAREDKLAATIDAECSVADILALDLCLNGVAGTTTVDQAVECISVAAREIVDTSVVPANRSYASISLIEAAYPPSPRCGDNDVNQLPGTTLLLGEECDGSDDGACSGACLPPGDVFECTCQSTPRVRMYNDASTTDTDAGWTGASHDQGVPDLGGWINELSECDCNEFTGATCTGASSDTVCTASGYQLPTCSWDLFSGTRCDAHGNGDGSDSDVDCRICDDASANAGDFCANSLDCDSLCYPDSGGAPVGPCDRQSECAAGETCKGRCDSSPQCYIVTDGAPLPISQGGLSACAVQYYATDVVGTRDIVTGEHELDWQLRMVLHLGENSLRPCPVCGGFCVGGANGTGAALCMGRCADSGDECQLDSDCPGIDERCSPESPDCPGGYCELEQVCGAVAGTPGRGNACTIGYVHPSFGNMSSDCLPNPGANITGEGLPVDAAPASDRLSSVPASVPCTSPGFELLDCHCPDDGGTMTKPNTCAPACNTGPELGIGCATGDGGSGLGTTCSAGLNAGTLCDEHSDCPGGLCDANPFHCVGDPTFEQLPCATNAECGSGVCTDACPSGRCLPLCIPSASDPTDGICAAGPPTYHCEGPELSFLSCSQSAADAGCSATCSGSGAACDSIADCPAGQTCTGSCPRGVDCEAGQDAELGTSDDRPLLGPCVPEVRNCYLDTIEAEGGSTLNGKGDPTNFVTAYQWCFGRTTSQPVNLVAGFGGPGKIRLHGLSVMNTDAIP